MKKYIIVDSTPKCTNGGMEKALMTVDVWEHAYYVDRAAMFDRPTWKHGGIW